MLASERTPASPGAPTGPTGPADGLVDVLIRPEELRIAAAPNGTAL
jgi:hypothetical protein